MKAVTIILGVLMALSGIGCILSPVLTFELVEYTALTITAIMMLLYGIIGIVNAAVEKDYGVNFLFGILSVIAGGLMFIPGMRLVAGNMALYIASIWFMLKGLTTIFLALNTKRVAGGGGWIWVMIIGIIGVLLGIYSFVHPLILAAAFGLLAGMYLLETGINLIIMAAESGN